MSFTRAVELARVRQQNPSWVIVAKADGTFTARRPWFGSQQILTVPTIAELELRLGAAAKYGGREGNGQRRSPGRHVTNEWKRQV